MDLSASERAGIVVRYLAKKNGVTQFEIGQKMGYTNKSAFSALLGGHKSIPEHFAERIVSLFPEINRAFLTGESDDMLLPGYEQPVIEEKLSQQEQRRGVYLPLELVKMFTDLSDTIRSQQETIRLLVGKKCE